MPSRRKPAEKPSIAETPTEAVLWFVVFITGIPWKVYISNPKLHPFLADDHVGYTDVDTASLYIHADCDDGRKPEVFFHELLHAVFYMSGYEFTVAASFEKLKYDAEVREEARVSALSPILWDALVRTKLVTLPPIPEAAALLRTAA